MFTGTWRRRQKPRRRVEARETSYGRQIFRLSRSVHVEAFRAARVPRRRSEVRNLRQCVGDFPKLSAACGLISVDRISGFSLGDA